MHARLMFFFVAVDLLATGCSTIDPEGSKVNKFGPQRVIQQQLDEPELVSLIRSATDTSLATLDEKCDNKEFSDSEKFNCRLADSLGKFYNKFQSAGTQNDAQLSRNRIQDHLIAASNDGCEAFKTVLKKKQANANFRFGIATLLFGGAGAVANGMTAAKNLAALAGASGGMRAEYNRDFYSDLAAHVITKGISSRRKDVLAEISASQKKMLNEYTLEAAIADVITYHGACSLIGGLEQAEGALSKLTDDVTLGLDVTKNTAERVSNLRAEAAKIQQANAETAKMEAEAKKRAAEINLEKSKK